MKKSIIAGLLVLFSACQLKYEPAFKTAGTPIRFDVTNNYGIQFGIQATPGNDATYYYFSLMGKEAFDRAHGSDASFMEYITDSLRQDFDLWKQWEAEYLERQLYFADFTSFYCHLGTSGKRFTNLHPSTEYVAFGFCMDPTTQKPVGELSSRTVTTAPVSGEVSPMVIDFRVTLSYLGSDALGLFSARPSVDGKPTNEPYLWGIVRTEELDSHHEGDLMAYLRELLGFYETFDDLNMDVSRDISTRQNSRIRMGEEYVLWGFAYRPSWEQAVFTLHFTAEPHLEMGYTRDKQD